MKTKTSEPVIFFKDGRIIEQPQFGESFEALTNKGKKEKLRPFVGILVYGIIEQVCIGCVDGTGLVVKHWECYDPYGTEHPVFLEAMEIMSNLLEINDNNSYHCYLAASRQRLMISNLFDDKAA